MSAETCNTSAQELAALMDSRANVYKVLSRGFMEEMDQQFAADLANDFCFESTDADLVRALDAAKESLRGVDDGLLDVCIVPKLNRGKILRILGRYQKGLHVSDPELSRLVTYRQVCQAEVRFAQPVTICLDGETFQGDHVTARVLPGAVRLVLPVGG